MLFKNMDIKNWLMCFQVYGEEAAETQKAINLEMNDIVAQLLDL
jgi:hypothetical protein